MSNEFTIAEFRWDCSACVGSMCKYAGERKQFGNHLGSFQMIQKMIAEMATETEMMRSFSTRLQKI